MKRKIFYIFEGDNLAYTLSKKLLLLGNEVYYVSKERKNIELLDGLKAYYSNFHIIQHDPTDTLWMESLEITKKVSQMIVLSEDDALNFVISWMLRQMYSDLKILTLVNHVENEAMFRDINVNTISLIVWMEKLIESSLNYEDITDFFNPYVDKLSILELTINKNDKCYMKSLKEVSMPENSIVGVLIKEDGTVMIPHGDTIIKEMDKLIVFSLKEQVTKVKETLKTR